MRRCVAVVGSASRLRWDPFGIGDARRDARDPTPEYTLA